MKILKQVAVIFGVCLLGQAISEVIPIPFPGSVISMVIMFILFLVNWLKPKKLKEINGFLLENMAFFFIPSGVGIITQFDVIKNSVLQIFIICVVSTVVTFAATAYTVKLVMNIQNKLRSKRRGAER